MKPSLDTGSLRRVAIVRCCGLGDVAQMTPLLQQIRADAPQAKIEVFLNANVAALLEGSPWVDRVHALPVADFVLSHRNSLLWRLWRKIRQQGPFDALLCLDLTWSRTALAFAVKAACRTGFVTEGWKPFSPFHQVMTIPQDYPRNADHTSLWFLRLWLGFAGTEDRGFSADLGHLKDEGEGPLPRHVALVPRAGNDLVSGEVKQWPMRYWPALARQLLNEGWTPVVLGRSGDLDMTVMPEGTLDMQGRLSIAEVARYLGRLGGVIGNDSGLYHIAMALGTPALGLFGPTAIARTGPFRAAHGKALAAALDCVPCCAATCTVPARGRPEAERPFCLFALTPELVGGKAIEHFSA